MVGMRNMALTPNFVLSASLILKMTRTAKSEFPPSSKKLSRTPTFFRLSISHQSRAIISSVGLRGASEATSTSCAVPSSGGNALRWTLPLGVTGNEGTDTKAAEIYIGRHRLVQQATKIARGDDGTDGRDDVGDETTFATHVVRSNDHAVLHARMTFEARFDFAQLDAVAANFYLIIETAEEFERAVRQTPH